MGVLAIIYLIADVFKLQFPGSFFIVFGTNALFAYFLSGILTTMVDLIQVHSGTGKVALSTWFYEKVCAPIAGNLNGSLMFAIIEMLIIWGVALILYRKKIMIRV
jgi:predicted acyltransferase